MDRGDDFYMVLPSNASPNLYPNNNASSFTVSWDQSIELNQNDLWKVALTECDYMYHPHTLTTNYAIEIKYFKRSNRRNVRVHFLFSAYKVNDYKRLYIRYGKDKAEQNRTLLNVTGNNKTFSVDSFIFRIEDMNKPKLDIYSRNHFRLEVNGHGAAAIGTDPIVNSRYNEKTGYHYINCPNNLLHIKRDPFRRYEMYIDLLTENIELQSRRYEISDDIELDTPLQLKSYFKKTYPDVFYKIKFKLPNNEKYDRKFAFIMGLGVYYLKFYGGLNFTLGYKNDTFESSKGMKGLMQTFLATYDDTEFMADNEPNLKRGVRNIFVYASICSPIQVGHIRAPLLRNIVVDMSKERYSHRLGQIRQLRIHNPMYIPVAASSFNHIEVNLRNDAGRYISFPDGSITTLTLHFKKTRHNTFNYKQRYVDMRKEEDDDER